METPKLVAVLTLLLAGNTYAQTLTTLWSSTGGNDAASPEASLVQGSDGNFYGTTIFGGTLEQGTVFKITPSGDLTNLHSFSGVDGDNPTASLVQGGDGNLYGTTEFGGSGFPGGGGSGFGTVFKVTPSGGFTSLYSFAGPPNDGSKPNLAGLIQSSDGDFYGTTYEGGATNYGTVFRVSTNGSESILHSFAGPPNDGRYPAGGLVQGNDGNFYGTTAGGGATNYGTVFKITPSGTLTILHSFNHNEGYSPGGLVQGGDGNFYGTTQGGGNTNLNFGDGYGMVFKVTPSGNLTNLYSFSGVDGNDPAAPLVQGSDGNFYGTTEIGGASTNCDSGCGTVFKITPSGNLTILHSFIGNDGRYLRNTGLVQGSDGNFYGTTCGGSSANCSDGQCGTVFKIIVPLNPPANQISDFRLAGSNALFAVPSVAGETYQLQFRALFASGAWSNVVGAFVTNSIGGPLTLTNVAVTSQPQGFYRFDITP